MIRRHLISDDVRTAMIGAAYPIFPALEALDSERGSTRCDGSNAVLAGLDDCFVSYMIRPQGWQSRRADEHMPSLVLDAAGLADAAGFAVQVDPIVSSSAHIDA